MSASLTVTLVRGIDYGAEQGGDQAAWAWYTRVMEEWKRPHDEPRADACDADTPIAGGDADGIPILVVYATESEKILWRDSGAKGSSTADVLSLVAAQKDAVSQHDARLEEYCTRRALPWREPRWLVTINNV